MTLEILKLPLFIEKKAFLIVLAIAVPNFVLNNIF